MTGLLARNCFAMISSFKGISALPEMLAQYRLGIPPDTASGDARAGNKKLRARKGGFY